MFALLGAVALAASVMLSGVGGLTHDVAPTPACPECPPSAAPQPAPPSAPVQPAAPAPTEQPAEAAPAEQPEQPAAAAEQPEQPEQPAEPQAAAATPPAPGGTGPWTIGLDPGSYEPDAAGQQSIAAIRTYLTANPDARVGLVGVNDIKKSSKRAKQAARKVRELIATGDVSPKRISTTVDQEPGAAGIVVRAEIEGGAR